MIFGEFVTLRPVRAAAPTLLQGQREAAVAEFEAQDGVEQGGYALKRRGGGPRGGGPASTASLIGSSRASYSARSSSARSPKARESVPSPTPAAAAMSAVQHLTGRPARAFRALLERGTRGDS